MNHGDVSRRGYWQHLASEFLAGRVTQFQSDRRRRNENSLRSALKGMGYVPSIRNYGKVFEVISLRKKDEVAR